MTPPRSPEPPAKPPGHHAVAVDKPATKAVPTPITPKPRENRTLMRASISLSETTVGREMKALGYRKISARPRHYAQNELAIDDFKKHFRPSWRRSAQATRPEPR